MRPTFAPSKSFFFDRQRVIDSLSKAKRSRMAKQGATVRTIARRSIRPAKRKKLGDLPESQQQAFLVRARIALAAGKPKPQLPFASSKPGEPPRNQTGLLKNNILFAYDPDSESVVAGPALLNSGDGAPETLEFGGRNDRGVFIEARPYMRPAMSKSIHTYPSVFKDSME
jgi:hypothetical protein